MTFAVDAHGLSKSYGALKAVDALELQVPTGIVLGFLGEVIERVMVGPGSPESGGFMAS